MTTMTFDNTLFETLHRSEDWKYTNVSALSKVDFGDGTQVDAVEIEAFDLAVNNPFVVFVNGVFNENASRLVDGIEITANNTSSLASRSNSMIPRGVSDSLTISGSHEKTIHVLQLVTGDSPVACYGNVCIHAGEGDKLSIAETHVALGDQNHLFMPCTEVVAGKNSSVTLVHAIRGSKQAYHLGSLHVEQHESSTVQTHTITLGGKRTRNEIYAYLDGINCESNFDGMYMLG